MKKTNGKKTFIFSYYLLCRKYIFASQFSQAKQPFLKMIPEISTHIKFFALVGEIFLFHIINRLSMYSHKNKTHLIIRFSRKVVFINVLFLFFLVACSAFILPNSTCNQVHRKCTQINYLSTRGILPRLSNYQHETSNH